MSASASLSQLHMHEHEHYKEATACCAIGWEDMCLGLLCVQKVHANCMHDVFVSAVAYNCTPCSVLTVFESLTAPDVMMSKPKKDHKIMSAHVSSGQGTFNVCV